MPIVLLDFIEIFDHKMKSYSKMLSVYENLNCKYNFIRQLKFEYGFLVTNCLFHEKSGKWSPNVGKLGN